ncbi:MAG: phage portal protein, partial [Methylococcaceae bacterium]|nr:phage portal protein [Methylococcaceae bacterium]
VQELLSGNCYAFPFFDRRGRLEKLIPVPWTMIKPMRDPETRRLYYEYTDERGEKHPLPPDAVFHIPGLGWDGVKGLSVVRNAAECIGIGLATDEFAGRFFSNGMNIGGLLLVDGLPSDKNARDEQIEDLREKFSGLGKAHRAMILKTGSDYKPIHGAMPLAEAQFLEYCKYTFAEVCGWFRVPLHKAQQMDRATDNNIEKSDLGFYKDCMVSWYRRWEQWINFKLFTPQDRAAGYFAEFNVSGLLRGDMKTQSEILHKERQNAIITGNEWRGFIGLNPSDDPMADRLLINGNMIPIEMAGKTKPANGGAGGEKEDG